MLQGALSPAVGVEAAGRADLGVLGRGEAAAVGRWGAVGGSGRQLEAALGWSPGAEHVPVVGLLCMAKQGRDVDAHLVAVERVSESVGADGASAFVHERRFPVLVHGLGGLTGPKDLAV